VEEELAEAQERYDGLVEDMAKPVSTPIGRHSMPQSLSTTSFGTHSQARRGMVTLSERIEHESLEQSF